MSGGHWNYDNETLKDTIFGYDKENPNPLDDLELSALLYDILSLLHEYDWYVSGDTGLEDWLSARDKFKKKWLKSKRSERLSELIDDRIEEMREELKAIL